MRRCVFLLLLPLLGLLATVPPARAGDWSLEGFTGRRTDWDGFAPGTRIRVRRQLEQRTPGSEASRLREQEIEKKLVEVREDAIVLEIATRTGDRWLRTRTTVPRRDPAKVVTEDLGAATLRVGEADFPCRKTRVRRPGPRGPEELVLWVNPGHGILRIERRGTGGTSILTATVPTRSVTVGDRQLEARVFALETGGEGPKRRGEVVLSLDVPEAMVSEDVRAAEDAPVSRWVTELTVLEIPVAGGEADPGPRTPAQDGQGDAPPR